MVKLQIPMDRSLRDGLEAKAARLGFSSAQEYVRVWAKAQVDNRHLDFGDDGWGQPTPAAAARLNDIAEEAQQALRNGELQSYSNLEDMMEHLNKL